MTPSRWARLRVKAIYAWAPRLASTARRRWAVLKNPLATVRIAPDAYLGPGFSLHAPFGGTFEAGPGTEFRRGFRCELGGPDAVVRFGAGCVATYDVLFQVSTSVVVGDRVMFGQAGAVFDGAHRYEDPTRPMLEQGYDFRPLTIGDDVTVLTKCTIVASLGERAVVAANAVVTQDVEPWTVVGGVPARALKAYGPGAAA